MKPQHIGIETALLRKRPQMLTHLHQWHTESNQMCFKKHTGTKTTKCPHAHEKENIDKIIFLTEVTYIEMKNTDF